MSEQELLDPSSLSPNKNETLSSLDKSSHLHTIFSIQSLRDEAVEDNIYGSTSNMLTEDEIFSTSPSNGGSKGIEDGHSSLIETIDCENEAVSESDEFEIEYHKHTNEENREYSHNGSLQIESSPAFKIITIFSSHHNSTIGNPATDDSVTIEELNSSDTEDDDNVKTFTILDDVKVRENNSKTGIVSDSTKTSCSADVIDKEIMYLCGGKDNKKMDLDNNQAEYSIGHQNYPLQLKPIKSKQYLTNNIKGKVNQNMWNSKTQKAPNRRKKKTKQTKTEAKSTRNIVIDLEKLTNPGDVTLKEHPVLQTYLHKKKTNNNDTNTSTQKLYQKLPVAAKQEQIEGPQEFSVFDFYDEDDEKRKIEKREKEKELKLIRERTCVHCTQIFKDPMDVLRHKREQHMPRKVRLSQKEIEPYLELENRTHCPLCFKLICPNGYKSRYIKHVMTHLEDSNFSCKVCGAKFRRKDHMQTHEKRHVVSF